MQRNLGICEERIKLFQADLHSEFMAVNHTGVELEFPRIDPTLQMNPKATKMFRSLQDVAKKHRESLASILANRDALFVLNY